MAAIDDLKSAASFLEQAIVDLENRLLSYTAGEFDTEIAVQTDSIVLISNNIGDIAPVGSTASGLELTKVS